MRTRFLTMMMVLLGAMTEDSNAGGQQAVKTTAAHDDSTNVVSGRETAMFGSGCFWCSEAVFQRVPGVKSVKSGYAGGSSKNPTYRQVSTGETGHAEVVKMVFDPRQVSYDQLLALFWKMHDPTTLNRQGADTGTQYRSVIFYFSPAQKAAAEAAKNVLDDSREFKDPVVTEIVPASDFYPAEDYHDDYYNQNKDAPYCRIVIQPKLKKMGLATPSPRSP